MQKATVPGTQGYEEVPKETINVYESIAFSDVHKDVVHLLPTEPSRVLDIGAGSGRDAAALAAMGHMVVAVEPMGAFRKAAKALHPSPSIEWVDDSLPHLEKLEGDTRRFDVIMLHAVWMHLDKRERQQAMPKIARLLRGGGVVILSLRHGPVPKDKCMYEVTAQETIALAHEQELTSVLHLENRPSAFNRTDVIWTRLAFSKGN